MIYSHEVQQMCCVKKGANHESAPIPEEGKWVVAKEIKDISGLTHGVGWCAPQQGACKLTLNVKDGIIQEALVETIGCSGMTHSAAMASEILPGKTILEALNTDLVCDAINTAMRELFKQIVYGRTQSAFSEGGLVIGASLEDLGKGLRSQVGTMFGTLAKGTRYLEMAEGYCTRMALDENDEVIGYEFVHLGKFMDFVKKGIDPQRVLVTGIPVRPAFARPASKEDVRRHLGLPENAPLFLVMSGSMGFGKVHLLAHELVSRLENGEQAVIICGNNKKRMRSLRLQFHKNPNVHIIGFTRHVAEYMAAADVLFTKPGGLSSTEAAVRRVPLVHTDPIPGCETKNRAFFVSRGMSVTGAHQKELAEAGISLARDDARQIAMRDAQHQNSHPQAGTSITHLLEKLVSE